MNRYLQARNDLRKGNSIENVCKKYDLTLKQLFNALKTGYPTPRSKNIEIYIHKNGSRYQIKKKHYGKDKIYGSFIDINEAKAVRDELIKLDWQVPSNKTFLGDAFIKPAAKKNKWAIQKYLNGTMVYFGTYHSRKDARRVRDELEWNDWDKSKLDEIIKKLGVEKV